MCQMLVIWSVYQNIDISAFYVGTTGSYVLKKTSYVQQKKVLAFIDVLFQMRSPKGDLSMISPIVVQAKSSRVSSAMDTRHMRCSMGIPVYHDVAKKHQHVYEVLETEENNNIICN